MRCQCAARPNKRRPAVRGRPKLSWFSSGGSRASGSGRLAPATCADATPTRHDQAGTGQPCADACQCAARPNKRRPAVRGCAASAPPGQTSAGQPCAASPNSPGLASAVAGQAEAGPIRASGSGRLAPATCADAAPMRHDQADAGQPCADALPVRRPAKQAQSEPAGSGGHLRRDLAQNLLVELEQRQGDAVEGGKVLALGEHDRHDHVAGLLAHHAGVDGGLVGIALVGVPAGL